MGLWAVSQKLPCLELLGSLGTGLRCDEPEDDSEAFWLQHQPQRYIGGRMGVNVLPLLVVVVAVVAVVVVVMAVAVQAALVLVLVVVVVVAVVVRGGSSGGRGAVVRPRTSAFVRLCRLNWKLTVFGALAACRGPSSSGRGPTGPWARSSTET